MKKMLLSLMLVIIVITAFSQDNAQIKAPSLGMTFFMYDFKTASSIRTTTLSSTIASKNFSNLKSMTPGFGLNYWQGITSQLDFSTFLGGSFLDYTNQNGKTLGTTSFLLEADAFVHAKMFPDNYVVVPYVTAGVGLSKYKGYYGATLPLGLGLQINIFANTFIMVDTQYRIAVSENTNYHFFHSIGIAGNLKSR